MQSLCKEVEYVRCVLEAKGQDKQIKELRASVKTEEMPIGCPDGNMAESVLKIKLCHQRASPRRNQVMDSALKHIIRNLSFAIRDAIID